VTLSPDAAEDLWVPKSLSLLAQSSLCTPFVVLSTFCLFDPSVAEPLRFPPRPEETPIAVSIAASPTTMRVQQVAVVCIGAVTIPCQVMASNAQHAHLLYKRGDQPRASLPGSGI